MGLQFRKSISIIPGVKLNYGKTGMSVSIGVPGFRKTFHTSGKVTTSVGIPGTGLYYVDTKNTLTQNNKGIPKLGKKPNEVILNLLHIMLLIVFTFNKNSNIKTLVSNC